MKKHARIAVLVDPDELYPPSDKKSLEFFRCLCNKKKVALNFVTQKDIGLLKNFSGLYIRTLTMPENYAYQWSVLGEYLNMPIIDTPMGIALGSDKHLQFELCKAKKIRMPATEIIYFFEDLNKVGKKISLKFPLVLKVPNGSFSNGVYKIQSLSELKEKVGRLFATKKYYSLILQEYIYTPYDWRIGMLNHKPIFICKYYMAYDHWQIIKYENEKIIDEGEFETIDIRKTPYQVLECAQAAAEILDHGFYGIDIKLHHNKAYLIEINDNPNLYFGIEDLVETDRIYNKILTSLTPA